MEDQDFVFRPNSPPFSPPLSPPFRFKRPSESSKPGLPLDRFPIPPRADFICRTCNGLVREPKECANCGVLMCSRCWDDSLCHRPAGYYFLYRGRDMTCPGCEETVPTRDPSRLLKRLIASLEVRCKNYKSGCTTISSVAEIKAHQKACQFRMIPCANTLCCKTTGRVETFLKVSLKPTSTLLNFFVCSENCRKALLFDSLLRENDIEKAISEFHELAKAVQVKKKEA